MHMQTKRRARTCTALTLAKRSSSAIGSGLSIKPPPPPPPPPPLPFEHLIREAHSRTKLCITFCTTFKLPHSSTTPQHKYRRHRAERRTKAFVSRPAVLGGWQATNQSCVSLLGISIANTLALSLGLSLLARVRALAAGLPSCSPCIAGESKGAWKPLRLECRAWRITNMQYNICNTTCVIHTIIRPPQAACKHVR